MSFSFVSDFSCTVRGWDAGEKRRRQEGKRGHRRERGLIDCLELMAAFGVRGGRWVIGMGVPNHPRLPGGDQPTGRGPGTTARARAVFHPQPGGKPGASSRAERARSRRGVKNIAASAASFGCACFAEQRVIGAGRHHTYCPPHNMTVRCRWHRRVPEASRTESLLAPRADGEVDETRGQTHAKADGQEDERAHAHGERQTGMKSRANRLKTRREGREAGASRLRGQAHAEG